jgi:ATP-dependent DNA ligase
LLLLRLVETFEKMEDTKSRILLTDHLVSLLRETPCEIIDKIIYLIQGRLGPAFEGVELGLAEKMTTRALAQSSGKNISEILDVYRKHGDLGDTAREVMGAKNQNTLFSEEMTVERVYSTLNRIARTTGQRSQEMKLRLVSSLLNEATPREARYILKFLMGTLRLGIADFTVLDALAIAFTKEKSNRSLLENAYNVSGDLGTVAKELACNGIESVRSIQIKLFKPIRPMLAERASNLEEGVERMNGIAAVEYKIDGERVQIHKGKHDRENPDAGRVELFSRRLENITSNYPDIVKAVKMMSRLDQVILEGEIVAVDLSTSEYLPFQELMHRRRKYGVEQAMQNYPVVVYIFDVLYNKGRSTIRSPYKERRTVLREIIGFGYEDGADVSRISPLVKGKKKAIKRKGAGVTGPKKSMSKISESMSQADVDDDDNDLRNSSHYTTSQPSENISSDSNVNKIRLMPQVIASDTAKIQKFMDSAIEAGCEGIMLKHLDSVYRAGSREYLWIKVKREYRTELADTLDLVIVGALYGRGRRVGRYGALLLAVYDKNRDLFSSVCKVGTGFTDQHLENFYNSMESLRIRSKSARVDTRMDQMDVWFEPKVVIEVIASEITLSPAHTAGLNSIRENYGLALRFPKFTGKIRDDKNPEDATSVQELVKMFKQQQKSMKRKNA